MDDSDVFSAQGALTHSQAVERAREQAYLAGYARGLREAGGCPECIKRIEDKQPND